MHGFYRLNTLRAFTISTLLLVAATASLVIVTNFQDNDVPPLPLVICILISSVQSYSFRR